MNRTRREGLIRRVVCTALGIAVVSLVLCLGYWFYRTQLFCGRIRLAPLEFSSDGWRTGDPLTRGRMANDLQDKHELVGMTMEEITRLLGQPDAVSMREGDPDAVLSVPDVIMYDIDWGHRIFGKPWMYVLDIRLDDDGVCREYGIRD